MSADRETAADWLKRLRSQPQRIREDEARFERIIDNALGTLIGGIPILIITAIINTIIGPKWTLLVLLLAVAGFLLLRGKTKGGRTALSELLHSWAVVLDPRPDSRPSHDTPTHELSDVVDRTSSTPRRHLVLAVSVVAAFVGGLVVGRLVAVPDEAQRGEKTRADGRESVAAPTPSQSPSASTPSDDDGEDTGGKVPLGEHAGNEKRTHAFRSPTQEELGDILLTENKDLKDFAGPVGSLRPDPMRGPLFEMVQAEAELCPSVSVSPPPAIEDAVQVFENYYGSFIGNEATSFGTEEEARDLLKDLERAATSCGFRVRSSRPVLGQETLRFVDDKRPYRDYIFYRVRVVVVEIVTKVTWDNHSSIADQLAEITEARAERLRFKRD